jgi:hypothetical protein
MALIVFSDFSSLTFECDAAHYDKFCALMPPETASDDRAEETAEQLGRIKRMGNATAATCRELSSHQYQEHAVAALAGLAQAGKPLLGPANSFAEYAPEPNPRSEKRRRVVRAQ